MLRIAKAEARKNFSEVVTRAGRGGERVKITHYGKTLAVLVSPSDLRKLHDCEGERKKDDLDEAVAAKPKRKAQPSGRKRG